MRTCLTAVTLALLTAVPAAAQDVRVAPGLVWHGAIFGDDDPKSAGSLRPTVSVVTRGQLRRFVGATFEAMLEPLGVPNPHFDERLHSFHALIGAEIGRTFTVRPAAGVAVQLWSGSRAESWMGLAPALAIAIGHRHPPSGYRAARRAGVPTLVHISPEMIARMSYSHGAFSWMAGIQVPFTWRQ
jgi:hypothetical protein